MELGRLMIHDGAAGKWCLHRKGGCCSFVLGVVAAADQAGTGAVGQREAVERSA